MPSHFILCRGQGVCVLGKQPLPLLIPGEDRIYVQTTASTGARLAASQTQGLLLASLLPSSQVSVGLQECCVHPGHLG